jgi:hypothetical protein
MCPRWRLSVVSLERVWRETIDLGAQRDETFGNDSNIVAEASGEDFEMTPHVFPRLAHFYPKCRFYPVKLRFYPGQLRFYPVDLRSNPDGLRGFDVHRGEA